MMFSQDEDDKSGHLAKLYLRETRMQSFMYKAGNAWGPSYQCTASGTYRDESAPLFVGSTLAFAAVCTVAGYSIFRYMKVCLGRIMFFFLQIFNEFFHYFRSKNLNMEQWEVVHMAIWVK